MIDQLRAFTKTLDNPLERLSKVLQSSDYQSFLTQLNDVDADACAIAQNLLETREYELRLKQLKASSLDDYIDELRVVTEAELVQALTEGTIVNATDEFGQPLPIRSDEDFSGAFLESPTATAWLDSALLLQVLNAFSSPQSGLIANAQGLRLRQVVIGGSQLNLNWLQLPFALGFEGCDFYTWLSASYLQVPWLSFDRCDFSPRGQSAPTHGGALNASYLKVEHELRFSDCTGLAQLWLPDANIGSFSLGHPEGEQAPSGAADAADAGKFVSVIDNANFGELVVPAFAGDREQVPFELTGSVDIKRIEGALSDIVRWLQLTDADGEVWEVVAEALTRSARADDAKYLRVAFKRHRNGAKNLLRPLERQQAAQERHRQKLERHHERLRAKAKRKGLPAPAANDLPNRLPRNPIFRVFVWLFADFTVRYFHKPFRAIGLLVVTFAITWVVAFAFHDQLIKSPLANDPIPANWLEEIGSTLAWSFMYALDSSFSPLSLGQLETMWPSSVWLVLLLATLKAVSIILLGLFLAAVTNLVTKRSE
ncbi:MAG: hypothetical protein GX862_07110 [Leucobacter sp.]|nr:hypothetical protein [Leucobacter sp.]